LMYAALCHDLGKVTTSVTHPDGGISSHGHAQAGVPMTKRLLGRITHNKELVHAVAKLVDAHMEPISFIKGGAKIPAYKRLASKLAPEVTMDMLADLSIADKNGRNHESIIPLTDDMHEVEAFRQKAKQLDVLYHAEAPVLLGRDLLDVINPGPAMGRLLKKAYDIQIQEGIRDKEELKKRVVPPVRPE